MAAPVISVRTNNTTNPKPATTTGWTGGGVPSITTMTDGTPAYQIASNGTATPYIFSNVQSGLTITAGVTYTLSANVELTGVPGDSGGLWNIRAHTNTGNVYYTQGQQLGAFIPGTATRISVVFTAPAGVAADLNLSVVRTAIGSAGVTIRMGQLLIEQDGTANSYFDGDTPAIGNTSFAWTGTANASNSIATTIAPYVAIGQQNQMWFGTTKKMQFVRVPSTGMSRSRVGYNQTNQLENGGLDIYKPSMGAHFEYKMDFGTYEATGAQGLDVFGDYANGFYGNGLIYFADPMYYDVNLFSPVWAAPGMTDRPYSLSGIGGQVATAANIYNQPSNSMITFVDDSVTPGTYDTTYYQSTIIPIPPGFNLWLGASGSASSGGVIRVESWVSGAASAVTSTNLTMLSATGATRFNTSISGSTAEYVKIGYSRGATTGANVTVTSMMAQLWPIGMVPTLTGSFQTGQGADGLVFLDAAIQETYILRDNSMRNVHYKGLSFSLGEVGTWR